MKQKKPKIWLAILSAVLFALVFCTGCGNNSNEGKYGPFSLNEIGEGCYVFNQEKNEFYACVPDERFGSEGILSVAATEASPVIWYADSKQYIPTLGKNCSLVLKTSKDLPTVSSLVQMVDYGTTIGAIMNRNFDPNVFSISKGNNALCKDSDASKVFGNGQTTINQDFNIRIVDIGGSKVNESMLSDVNTIQGLEEDKDYKVTYYIGTQYHEVPVTADTHVFSTNIDTIRSISKYTYTKDGYVVLQLPEDLEKGYYYINQSGVFFYDPNA